MIIPYCALFGLFSHSFSYPIVEKSRILPSLGRTVSRRLPPSPTTGDNTALFVLGASIAQRCSTVAICKTADNCSAFPCDKSDPSRPPAFDYCTRQTQIRARTTPSPPFSYIEPRHCHTTRRGPSCDENCTCLLPTSPNSPRHRQHGPSLRLNPQDDSARTSFWSARPTVNSSTRRTGGADQFTAVPSWERIRSPEGRS